MKQQIEKWWIAHSVGREFLVVGCHAEPYNYVQGPFASRSDALERARELEAAKRRRQHRNAWLAAAAVVVVVWLVS